MTNQSKVFRRAAINAAVLIIFCIFSDQLYATLWVFILPVGFFVVLFFAIAFIKSMSFWIRNKSEPGRPWLPFTIRGLAVLVVCLLPSADRSSGTI